MDFSKYTIGFGITGSFCTHEKIKKEIQRLVDLGATVIPVFSYQTQSLDTRFGKAADFMQEVAEMTGNTQRTFGCHGHCAMHGKFLGKTGGGDHGYAGAHGGKGAFAEQPSACHFHLDK